MTCEDDSKAVQYCTVVGWDSWSVISDSSEKREERAAIGSGESRILDNMWRVG